MFNLLELLPPPPPKIRIVDVGAQIDPQLTDVYQPLVRAGCASIVGFEPVAEACARLNASGGSHRTYLPYAVGEGDVRQFRICADSKTSSLYEPNTPLLSHFHLLEDLCRVVDRREVRTTPLDSVREIEDVDFLKLDVQGAEADVLRGGARVLSQAVVVHAEVEFLPLYKNQPLFGDIDALLRAHGFLFHTFIGFATRAFRPVVINNDPSLGIRQQLWSEAVYVKSFLNFKNVPPEKLLRLALILHEVYGSYDLCALALKHCDERLGAAYIERLTGSTAPAPAGF